MVSPESQQITAQKYAERTADEILKDEKLASEIAAAYRELGTAERTYVLLAAKLPVRPGVKPKTMINIVNLVVNEVIPSDQLAEIRSEARSELSRNGALQVQEAKRERGLENGKHFFSPEETEELMLLGKRVDDGELSYADIPALMKAKFGLDTFTRDNCRKRYQNVRYTRSKKPNGNDEHVDHTLEKSVS